MNRWEQRAACRNIEDASIFFNHLKYKAAKAVCKSCPVKRECLAFALQEEVELPAHLICGVFGGLSPRERVERRKCV